MKLLDKTEDRLILTELFKANGQLGAYLLHEKYKLSPGQIYSSVSKLHRLGVAHFDGSTIVLTA
jgi:hypothetical protein